MQYTEDIRIAKYFYIVSSPSLVLPLSVFHDESFSYLDLVGSADFVARSLEIALQLAREFA